MVKRMLIDATHPEETRVVVVNGTRLEELDVETSTKKQLKGNIYLAKVVRVEPSLQAAFVEYGGNRHGFLAFSEIHPDYFQIPVADRQALLAAQRAEVLREVNGEFSSHDGHEGGNGEAGGGEAGEGGNGEGHLAAEAVAEAVEVGAVEDAPADKAEDHGHHKHHVETVGGDDVDEAERRRARLLRNYKIQEVIKRRQIMLVQVVKEERGNKGAALTTYLSLAGRYCVLMPNTARGGGVSRKITNANDRRRLKAIANELEIPDGMAVIVRTAGSERSKAEIRRDYEYLLRMWDSVRELTLKSSAPALTYEEASLIKRSIRDLYSRDIEEVLVDGDEGYRLAKDYMRMLTPSHAKKVQPYKDPIMPLFHRYQVESQLDAMHSPVVQLRSGGYIVISQTEALVAIDVNSGRATKERHIEETALKTNQEAAEEIARQLRLRDLAGLIVIDFIDMEESRNNHAVERRLKDALKHDRARIQVGKISAFGLLELSRQRLRPSLQETTFSPCPHCAGTGLIRSVESAAVHVLRAIEEEGIRRRSAEVTVTVPTAIALYILNQKRAALAAIEERYDFRVLLTGDDSLIPPAYRMDRVKAEAREEAPRAQVVTMDDNLTQRTPVAAAPEEAEEAEEVEEEEVAVEGERGEEQAQGEGDGRKRRRRRRRKRRNGEGVGAGEAADLAGEAPEGGEAEAAEGEEAEEGEEGEEGDERQAGQPEHDQDGEQRKRRRGRRGGRRRRREGQPGEQVEAAEGEEAEGGEAEGGEAEGGETPRPAEVEPSEVQPSEAVGEEPPVAPAAAEGAAEEAPAAEQPAEKPKRKRAPRKKAEAPAAAAAEAEVVAAEPVQEEQPAEKPKRKRAPRKKAAAAEAPAAEAVAQPAPEPAAEAAPAAAEPVPVEAEKVEPQQVAAEPETLAAEPAPAEEAGEAPAEPAKPGEAPAPVTPKRGWWNRLMS